MPFKKAIKSKLEMNNSFSSDCILCDSFESKDSFNIFDDTRERDATYSPDIIGVDWNDTFDRLISERPENECLKNETPNRKSTVKRSLHGLYKSGISQDAEQVKNETPNRKSTVKKSLCGLYKSEISRDAEQLTNETPNRKSTVKKSLCGLYKSGISQDAEHNSDILNDHTSEDIVCIDSGEQLSFNCKAIPQIYIQNQDTPDKTYNTNNNEVISKVRENSIQPVAKSTPMKRSSDNISSLSHIGCTLNLSESAHVTNNENKCGDQQQDTNIACKYKKFENYKPCRRPDKPLSINLLPGKKWRRSLNVYIHNKSLQSGLNIPSIIDENNSLNLTNSTSIDYQRGHIHDNITNISIVDKQLSYISISSDDTNYSSAPNEVHESRAKSRSVLSSFISCSNSIVQFDPSPATAYEIVLRRCGQTSPLPFSECYPDISLRKCHKIGEGLFGEVYLYKDIITQECSVIKIIPIEGSLLVNGEKQKKFNEILSEIIIVMELSNLRSNEENATSGFSELKKISCVRGKYPQVLIDLWNLYDEQYCSENDNPEMFGDDQLYIVLELGNGGRSLEAFQFTHAKQSLSVLRQVALSLAIAEKALDFEHRDLHWGNVLVVTTSEKTATYKLDGLTITLPLHGVKATIIDFTFSRITFNDQALYSDLGADEELFSADGDYQFDIYRLMREKNCNNWVAYQPYSNILWLHYLCDKMIKGARYTQTKLKAHKINQVELQLIKDSLLSYNNVNEFLEDFNYFA